VALTSHTLSDPAEQAPIEWRDIPGYEGAYQASTAGQIKSLEKVLPFLRYGGGKTRTLRERILKLREDRYGYLRVNLYRDGKMIGWKVHLLVALTFLGPRPEGMVIAHGDGNQRNNSIRNLRYATRKENEADKVRPSQRGPVLCKSIVRQVYESRLPASDAAKKFGITLGHAKEIKRGLISLEPASLRSRNERAARG
jgi:hypothetical protein